MILVYHLLLENAIAFCSYFLMICLISIRIFYLKNKEKRAKKLFLKFLNFF